MPTHERHVKIEWEWEVPETTLEEAIGRNAQLDLHAEEHIRDMMKQGYREGELHYDVNEISYSGYWRAVWD